MSSSRVSSQTWVAFGPAGAIGSIHRIDDGFAMKHLGDAVFRGVYPSLDVAQRALHASLPPGADRPEFREH